MELGVSDYPFGEPSRLVGAPAAQPAPRTRQRDVGARHIGHGRRASGGQRSSREHGLLQQNPVTRKYSPSLRAYSIGSAFVNHHPLSPVALAILRELAGATGHSATVSVIEHQRIVHLLAVEGPLFVDARWRAGRSIVFHVAASALFVELAA